MVRSVPLDGGAIIETQGALGVLEIPPEATPPSRGVALTLPCRDGDADLWFAETPAELERAKALCGGCPIRVECLSAALGRAEPWGVWGGEILERGAVVPRKKPRGRPSKADLARDRAHAEATAALSA